MVRRSIGPWAGLLVLAASACQAPCGGGRDGVRAFSAAYAQAFVDEDADALLGLMTDDVVVLGAGKPPLDRAAVRAEVDRDLASMEIHELRFVHDDLFVGDDWAWVRGRSSARISPADGGEEVVLGGHFLWILERGPDGVWRIACDSSAADG